MTSHRRSVGWEAPRSRIARSRIARAWTSAIVVMLACGALGMGDGVAAQDRPPEEDRFDTTAFLNGLRRRGLTELIQQHLKEFPPASAASRLLLQRQIELATYADVALSDEARLAALGRANRLLQQLIDSRPTDPRRFQWRYDVAASLINQEAAPAISRIVLLGGAASDRRTLAPRAERAVSELTSLKRDISDEYDRLDAMSVRQYERVEQTGFIDRLERVEQQAGVLLIWALYDDALARPDDDPVRAARLQSATDLLGDQQWLLETPHELSHLQAPSLLIAGMIARLVGHADKAESLLARAVRVAQQVGDPEERGALEWVVLRGTVERARALRDAGRASDAIAALSAYERQVSGTPDDNFGVRLVLAMAKRSVYATLAQAARAVGDLPKAAGHQAHATAVLLRLARTDADSRDELYGTLYDLIGADADPADLDAIERTALMAGLLRDSRETPPPPNGEAPDPGRAPAPDALALLDRVIALGRGLVAADADTPAELLPEILFNLAVAEHRRGNDLAAARRFLTVGRDYPRFRESIRAAVLAVQIAYQLRSAGDGPDAAVQPLYLDALAALVTPHAGDPAARYWRFYYAQALEDAGRYADAADQYLLVDPLHDRALEAMCFRARSLARALDARGVGSPDTTVARRRDADEIFDVLRDFKAVATRALAAADPPRRAEITQLLAEADLISARTNLAPPLARPIRALELLSGFEERFPDAGVLTGRVLSTRLSALVRLGRWADAGKVIDAYVRADPAGAGATLQTVYVRLLKGTPGAPNATTADAGNARTRLAVDVARALVRWAQQQTPPRAGAEMRALKLQWAEALLSNAEPAQARRLFEQCGASALPDGDGQDARAAVGLAESYFQERDFERALPIFNHVAMSLPPDQPLRWKALLRDLQCRRALGHDPKGIIKAIYNQQQSKYYRDPDAGGGVAADLDRLLAECRRDAGV